MNDDDAASTAAAESDAAVPTAHRRVLAGYAATVFVSSALLLVLEIVAGRLVAPYVGVSLYTWTSIIGVILAGLSLGNWLGGLWADNGATGRSVGWVLAAGGLYCLLSLAMLNPLGAAVQAQGLTLLSASFTFAAVLFFVPAALIGIVTPLLTTLALRLDPRAGHVVGRMHALAAIGSIVGTFAAGWWLVQSVGTRAVVLGTGVALLALGAPFLRRSARPAQALLLIAVLAAGLLASLRGGLVSSCDRESAYFCIRVVERPDLAPPGLARGLVLDHLLHGINHMAEPDLLLAPYVHGLDELAHAHFLGAYDDGLDWFFAGGGAYSQPRALQALSPASRITVAELDPRVTLTAAESLGLQPAGMTIEHRDARLALADSARRFDVIVGDVFHDVAIPYHLVTREFAELVRARLAPDGLYLMNVVDTFPDPRLIKAIVKTLRTEFRHVDIWMDQVPEDPRVTFIVSAGNGPRLPKTVPARRGFQRAWSRMTEDIMAYGTPPADLPLLTDDYAPVERLIAGLLLGEDG
ncbi:fused MFS/spermidine synthase [uncultured Thiohalocapsa sp.]|uniref:fused MFS/spermidine synthase n=1 Tax=uncultured Thiohalocapsa sp. TaxID=768990 RepID=UPI0025ED3933|nr:fused MFS/spermidine synthase [uncultured Thiohalocapsa sp.]